MMASIRRARRVRAAPPVLVDRDHERIGEGARMHAFSACRRRRHSRSSPSPHRC
jgi:hypothetical protein